MCDHHHDGNGGGGGPCSRDNVAQFDYKPDGMSYTMESHIAKEKVVTLNEFKQGSGVTVFKPWNEHKDKSNYVDSDVDEELLFFIPFSSHVRLTGITFIGDLNNTHPARVRIFKDRENMSFTEAQTAKTVQEMELKQDDDAQIDYPLIATKFSDVTSLTLHFPANFGAERTRIYYIGLRGEFLRPLQRERVVIATYEARPIPDDHKVHRPVEQQQYLAK